MSLSGISCQAAAVMLMLSLCIAASGSTSRAVTIVCRKNASKMEALAAREVQRYVYLRTGRLPEVSKAAPKSGDSIIISTSPKSLHSQEYALKTTKTGGRSILRITGGDGPGVLYGAYRFAEHLGFRFDLDRDIIPDGKIDLKLPMLNERRKPLFGLRGIQPFHDFPEGPDWWDEDNYKAIITQLPKLGMNFIGLHTYPENGPNAEPTVWTGLPSDIGPDGKVKFSYPSSYYNTARDTWGYSPKKTSDYIFGASELFTKDAYAPDVQGGDCPEPVKVEDCNAVFERTSAMLRSAFEYAHSVGVKTCVGTETPLIIPETLAKRLKAAGKDPKDPAVVSELYKGTFMRATKAYPLDYYWLWTGEGWGGSNEQLVNRTISDMQIADKALKEVKPPFKLATCGWVLGPSNDRGFWDKIMPRDVAVSSISQGLGKVPVDPAYENMKGREKWAIPWFEDDWCLTSLELYAGRMRQDANDALRYGCTGLMGIHWRTRNLSPTISALAQAGWDQTGWSTTERASGAIAGAVLKAGNIPIKGADDPTIYQSQRWGMPMYRVAMPNGTYTVTLKFCELAFGPGQKRVFDVRLQGKKVIESLDVLAKVGGAAALDYTFRNVKVENGLVEIEFQGIADAPIISGIIVEGPKATKKINCGGSAYKDWSADLVISDMFLPVTDFYKDWATAQFGQSVGNDAARIFEKLDGKFPVIAGWVGGPGGFGNDPRPWKVASGDFAFADEFAALRPRVAGTGCIERFDYWMNYLKYVQSFGRFRCALAPYSNAMQKLDAEKDPSVRKKIARDEALPARIESVKALNQMYSDLLAAACTTGEMGTIANWEQHLLPDFLTAQADRLEQALGEPLPASAKPNHEYEGPTKIIVPAVRTSVRSGEALRLKVIILSQSQPRETALYWRPMGKTRFSEVKLVHGARGVYYAQLPSDAASGVGFEYNIRVKSGSAEPVCYPTSDLSICQTVIVMP